MANSDDYLARVVNPNQEAVRLYGMNELLNLINKVGVPDEAIIKANQTIGRIVINEAKQTAVFKNPTGALLRSIRPANLRNRVVIRAGNKNVPYANPIHWGWFYDKNNFIKKNIKPNPFLSRALGYKREEIIATYNKNMQDLIDRNYSRKTRR